MAKIEVVRQVLLNEDKYKVVPEVPTSAREMLATGLPHMVSDFKEDRVDFQNRMLEFVGDHLNKVEEQLSEVLKEKTVLSDEAKEARKALDVTKQAAKAELEEKKDTRREKETTLET